EELYDRPATRFVADFIGRTNLLRGTVRGIDAERARIELTTGESTTTMADGLRPGDAIELSVRPEVVRLNASEPAGPGLPGRVEQAAYLGANFSYVVRTTGGLELTVHAPKSDGRLVVGTNVAIQWRPEDALVLAGRLATATTGEIAAEEATS
ncbi:MAG TPA: TOBE domain-containing protein, partial [Candidatus Polarisedimenticolia bacterium]|nr:TOBE domain-containing protein [Candidatus Polarisedimenticolia bacterium]